MESILFWLMFRAYKTWLLSIYSQLCLGQWDFFVALVLMFVCEEGLPLEGVIITLEMVQAASRMAEALLTHRFCFKKHVLLKAIVIK